MVISDSVNLITSPTSNLLLLRYTNSTLVSLIMFVIWTAVPLSVPRISSPNNAFEVRVNPDGIEILSKIGADVFNDSYTPITLATSGTFKEISLSSTLRP